MIDPDDILGSAGVRELAGGSRATLKYRMENRGFPRPFKSLPGSASGEFHLWDRREVLAWLKENEPRQYRALRRAKAI